LVDTLDENSIPGRQSADLNLTTKQQSALSQPAALDSEPPLSSFTQKQHTLIEPFLPYTTTE